MQSKRLNRHYVSKEINTVLQDSIETLAGDLVQEVFTCLQSTPYEMQYEGVGLAPSEAAALVGG